MNLLGYRLTCRPDRIEAANSTLYIYDWKSGFPGKREDAEKSFQGQFYAAALLWGFNQDDPLLTYGAGINDVWFYEVFPRQTKGEDSKEIIAYEGVWSRTELYEFKTSLERHIVQIEEGLETGKWEARDGSWCGRCPAEQECPIPPHLRQIESINSPEEAEVALTHKLALDREGARYQKALREWFKENGIVYVGDYAFDAKVSNKRAVDWDAVAQGKPLEEAVTPGTRTNYAARKLTAEEANGLPG
jgi:PD-(D/E)XK nuclease superfamily